MLKKIAFGLLLIPTLIGLALAFGVFEPGLVTWVKERIGRPPGVGLLTNLRWIGWALASLPVWVWAYLRFIFPKHELLHQGWTQAIEKLDIWLDTRLGRWIDFSESENKISWNTINRWDVVFIILAMTYAGLYTLERMQGNFPLVFLGSDAANIASMAAAHDHPELFGKDYFLGDPDNLRVYFQLHILLVRWLAPLLGNYGLPFIAILGPIVFLTLVSHYWFGRLIMGDRFWAFMFSFFNLIPLYLLFENWGLMGDPVPRTLMQALVPFILGMVWIWKSAPHKWIIIAIATGALTYIHAVGAPTLMAVVILGLFSQMPKHWSIFKKVQRISTLSFLMILTASVFIFTYTSARTQAGSINYFEIIELYRAYFPQDILNIPLITNKLVAFFTSLWILPMGLIGLVLVWAIRRKERMDSGLIFAWLSGVLIVSLIVPYFLRTVESFLRILPIETEFVRGSRYFILFFGLSALWGLSIVFNKARSLTIRVISLLLAFLLFINVYSFRRGEMFTFENTAKCLSQGKILCVDESDYQTLIRALNEKTPANSGIFFSQFSTDTIPLTVRYLALRPLVFSWKDRGTTFASPGKLQEWHEAYQQLNQYKLTTDWFIENPEEFLQFTRDLGAEYVVLNLVLSPNELTGLPVEIIYTNQTFTVLKLLP